MEVRVKEAIGKGLSILAGHCDGARALDGEGFSKCDSEFGHSLADFFQSRGFLSDKQAVFGMKFIKRYRKQLPQDILTTVFGEGQ